jgi:hypothetical protein|tara:strand:- start:3130 stop:3396 length:267 start_codon:yes stop_codon:yes gene_type:complete
MKYYISNRRTAADNHQIVSDGVLRTFPAPIKNSTIRIYIDLGQNETINNDQAFALFALMLNPSMGSLTEPDISGGLTTWDEISTKAKR